MSTIAQRNLNNHSLGMAGLQEFGALIKRARDAKGLTQAAAGQLLGRPHTFLVRLERGENSNPPDPQTFHDLGKLLGLSPREMLESLGYLFPEAQEPGVAYVIREGDPRVEVLAMLEDASPAKLETIRQLVKVLSAQLP